MPTFVVSLFLPYTVDFNDLPTPARRDSPPPRAPPSRRDSTTDIIQKPASLFAQQTPPRTPAIADQEEFFKLQPSAATIFPKPHNPRTLVRSDSHIPEWGTGLLFNQPKSTANPPPSENVLQYTKSHFERRDHKPFKQRRSPPGGRSRERKGTEWGEWTIEPALQGNGGLTNAVRSAISAGAIEDDVFWMGTLGFPTDVLGERQKDQIHERLESEFDALAVYVSDSDLDGHYAHYCKTILWPVFHYQIPDHPKSKAYEDHSWVFYVNLNQAFADKIIQNYKRGDIIWIHDYHLLLVPKMVRDKLPDAQIGFFLHSAFPSSEVFRCLSVRNQLLEGMLGANLVAFQTREYAHHFLQTCSRLLVVEATEDGVQLDQRFVNVMALPIGIDPKGLSELRQEPEVREWIDLMTERYKGKKLIVARDKLDHVRGVRQKLLAFELFLNKYPEWRDQVVMIQVATSTTENQELAETVSDIVTRIDSVHSTLAHQPLVFLRQDIAFSQYLALLTVADTLMITSLREGMNLTCHEFVFCQDGDHSTQKHGPVILSEFTGSASVFDGHELSVNPWDYQQCAEAIKIALEMSDEEKDRRYNKLRDVVDHHTGEYWCKSLVDTLARVHEEQYKRDTLSIPRLSATQQADIYKRTHKRLFILDYEGTLATYGSPTRVVINSQDRLLDIISTLLADPANIVYIMSSRNPKDLEFPFSRVSGLGFIAENGCFLREAGEDSEWTAFPDLDKTAAWKDSVEGILQYYVERVEGSWIEERRCALVFHYEKVEDQESAGRQAGDCANHINEACQNQRVRAIPTKDSVIIEPIDWDKGTAAKHIWSSLQNAKNSKSETDQGRSTDIPDFLFVAGNDRDDEVIFKWAAEIAERKECENVTSVNVGSRNTAAMSTLTTGTTGLLSALQRIANPSGQSKTGRQASVVLTAQDSQATNKRPEAPPLRRFHSRRHSDTEESFLSSHA